MTLKIWLSVTTSDFQKLRLLCFLEDYDQANFSLRQSTDQSYFHVCFLLYGLSDEIMQKAYGLSASLWETGYYATESTKPLSTNELNLFLDSHVTESSKQ